MTNKVEYIYLYTHQNTVTHIQLDTFICIDMHTYMHYTHIIHLHTNTNTLAFITGKLMFLLL